ncbi:hypothetical protein BDK51DRAFT_44079 [Blyttiomyces helicus]|uniref:Uncharacterized protein n=1 Tax=Blyttiomyces helicus TaxID=388810 RepID=A0A4V1IQI1_9FUNG|nr:hypothetical protein BDK51DRAFT_44079 [Blyttiomyces helicus]|eukprot:RKO86637.1 hypothetical protein BDK51DRAFT_44079 [Blyttiomyces helicus]
MQVADLIPYGPHIYVSHARQRSLELMHLSSPSLDSAVEQHWLAQSKLWIDKSIDVQLALALPTGVKVNQQVVAGSAVVDDELGDVASTVDEGADGSEGVAFFELRETGELHAGSVEVGALVAGEEAGQMDCLFLREDMDVRGEEVICSRGVEHGTVWSGLSVRRPGREFQGTNRVPPQRDGEHGFRSSSFSPSTIEYPHLLADTPRLTMTVLNTSIADDLLSAHVRAYSKKEVVHLTGLLTRNHTTNVNTARIQFASHSKLESRDAVYVGAGVTVRHQQQRVPLLREFPAHWRQLLARQLASLNVAEINSISPNPDCVNWMSPNDPDFFMVSPGPGFLSEWQYCWNVSPWGDQRVRRIARVDEASALMFSPKFMKLLKAYPHATRYVARPDGSQTPHVEKKFEEDVIVID